MLIYLLKYGKALRITPTKNTCCVFEYPTKNNQSGVVWSVKEKIKENKRTFKT